MYTKTSLIIVISILILSTVSSLEIKTSKEQFMQGETFQATLTGNILNNIQKADIGFYREHVQEALDFDITKINETYHIYAILPYKSEMYTLKIKDVSFKEQNKVTLEDIEKNFTINNQTAEFNVKPGFIISNKDFKMNIHNNRNAGLVVVYIIENVSYSSTIPPQDSKEITVPINTLSGTKETRIIFNSGTFSYNIPAYIIKNFTGTNNQSLNGSNNINVEKLKFLLGYLNNTLKRGETFENNLEITNLGEIEAIKINLSVSDSLKEFITLKQNSISSLKPLHVETINISVKALKSGNFSGFLTATSENSSAKIAINLKIGENVTSSTSIKVNNSCLQLGGKKCESGNYCNINNVPSSDGFCCLGECKSLQQNQTTERNWFAIIIVLIILGAIGVFFWVKYKKPKGKSMDILNKRSKNFEDKFEVSGKLSKI